MEKLQRLYRVNLNGIIATLAFHLLVLGSLLFARLQNGEIIPVEALFVDMVAEEIKPAPPEKDLAEQNAQAASLNSSRGGEHNSNRAVNAGDLNSKTSGDPFFDKEYAR